VGPVCKIWPGNSVPFSNKLGSWTCQDGKPNTKPNSRASFREGSSFQTRAFAMQSSSAPARRCSLRGGWAGQNLACNLQPDPGGAGPFQPRGSAREPVTGLGAKSYDSSSGQVGCKVAWNIPSIKVQDPLGSICEYAEWAYCARQVGL
jgi:hypothetical protein